MTPDENVLGKKLLTTGIAVAVILVAAVGADYLSNTFVFGSPRAFTPVNTALIAFLVSTPISYFLISQHLDMQRVQEQLVKSAAQKDRAVLEVQLRRDEAESARAEAERALERLSVSEKLYRLLADNQTDLISLWTANGRRVYCSPSTERTFGFTTAEILAMPSLANMQSR